MKRGLIAPFRLDRHPNGIDPAALLELCRTDGFRNFLDLLDEAVIVVDAEDNVIAVNKAAEAGAGIQKSTACGMPVETVSARSRIDLQPLVAGRSPGRRKLSLRYRNEPGELAATVYALADEHGGLAARMLIFPLPASGAAALRSKPAGMQPFAQGEALPLYQTRLEPLIDLGVRAFRARRRILLLGETGVGKTTLVMQMHRQVAGPESPFVHVNCSSISEGLFEAEMFGYERGAFTGALAGGKPGFIETANGGTLFLDEIGDMPRSQQAKLLKFLEDGCIQPVGSTRQKRVDVYVVCATNRDLAADVQKRRFREDLYYRIAMIPLAVPPLRQHREELPQLIDTLIANVNLPRKTKLTLTAECRRRMIEHDYPGNMRELLGVIARIDLLADEVAGVEHLPPQMQCAARLQDVTQPAADGAEGGQALPLKEKVRAYERQLIDEALKAATSKRQAAKALGIDISSLIRKLQE